MNIIKKMGLVSVSAMVLVGSFTGCSGAGEPQSFESKSGITVEATSKWKEATEEQILETVYQDFSSEDLQYVDLALIKGSGMFCTVEKTDMSEDLAYLEGELGYLQEAMAIVDSGLLEELGADEAAAVQAEFDMMMEDPAIKELFEAQKEDGTWDVEEMYRDFINEDVLASWEYYYGDNELISSETVEILGVETVLLEYKQPGTEDSHELHIYEANIIKNGMNYTISSWTMEKLFDKNKQVLKEMILTVK